MTRAWPLLVLAGCGRIGFDDQGAAGDGQMPPSGHITITLKTDRFASDPANLPVADAYVFVAGRATLQRTDAAGTVDVLSDGGDTIHVAYRDPVRWRLYTIVAAPTATHVDIGGRVLASTAIQTMNVIVPAGGSTYELRLPKRCAQTAAGSGSTTILVVYDAGCEGEAVAAAAIAYDASNNPSGLSVMTLQLTSGQTVVWNGAYLADAVALFSATNIPAGPSSMDLTVFWLDPGGDVVDLGEPSLTTQSTATTATLSAKVMTGGNAIQLSAAYGAGGTKGVLLAGLGSATTPIDASDFLAPYLGVVGSGRTAQWMRYTNETRPDPDLQILEGLIGSPTDLLWTAIVPAQTLSMTLPVFPPEVAIADPGTLTWGSTRIVGLKGAEVRLSDIDARWTRWLYGQELPPSGLRIASEQR